MNISSRIIEELRNILVEQLRNILVEQLRNIPREYSWNILLQELRNILGIFFRNMECFIDENRGAFIGKTSEGNSVRVGKVSMSFAGKTIDVYQ